jgi:hypothetical protein
MESQNMAKSRWQKWEKTLGGLKFAVILLLLFALSMAIGTFLESYYGTDFANRVLYKKFPFMLLQFGMFISILFAAFLRLPPKKRLYGFYTIHSGLICLGCGSFITWYAGVDGNIILPPNEPSREVILNQDVFKIHYPEQDRVITLKLPFTAFETSIDQTHEGITVKEYLPFAEKKFAWKDSQDIYNSKEFRHTSSYLIHNPQVSQEFTLSLHPEGQDFESSLKLGPLTISYMPEKLADCFSQNNLSKLIIWDRFKGQCYTPEQRKIPIKKTESGKRFLVVKNGDQLISFFPDISPWPMDEKLKVRRSGNIRIFSKGIFEKRPHLFLFGKKIAYFIKDKLIWEVAELNKAVDQELPWMGFALQLIEHEEKKVPVKLPYYTLPIQKNGSLIKGAERAIRVVILNKEYWVTDRSPIQLLVRGKKVVLQLTKESLRLPFEFVLTNFKMDKNPGTNSPASYESFVKIFTETGPQSHHVYMNNPLKHQGFTFYQASYQQDRQGNYISTLSANVDPGRFLKYLGSLMLVFGSLWHYWLNYRKKKKSHTGALVAGTGE